MKRSATLTSIVAAGLLAGAAATVTAQDEPEPLAPSLWTATWNLTDGEQVAFEEMDGFLQITGRDVATLDASDPRISGQWQQTMTMRVYGSADDSFVVRSGSIRLENDGGAWTGTLKGFAGDPFNHQWHELTGEDGYEGLTAVLSLAPEDGQLEGVIVPDELPPTPDLLLEE